MTNKTLAAWIRLGVASGVHLTTRLDLSLVEQFNVEVFRRHGKWVTRLRAWGPKYCTTVMLEHDLRRFA